MPVYEYECQDCSRVFEVTQRISEAPLSVCSECSGQLRKLISRTAFHLKGSGWYADGYSAAPCAGGKCEAAGTPAAKTTEVPACKQEGAACPGCPSA